jgi:3-hydroxyisobutyrate dehydrogenase
MATIGFIGLGNMGGPMAARLVAAGHKVRGFDMQPDALQRLRDVGGEVAASLAEAATDADAVVTMLPAGEHVRAVLGEVLPLLRPGALVVESSTIDVATTRAMHAAAAERGCPMLDAPVSGGTAGAAAGTLTFMCGGEASAFEQARPLLAAMGKAVVLAGGPGAGQAAKVCNNLILGISMVAVAEAFALAERLGLSAQSLFDVASTSSGQCWALTSYCPVPGPVPGAPSNRDYTPGFAVALMLKDLTLASEAAAQAGAPQVLGGHAREAYERLAAAGLGGRDFSVIAKALGDGSLS